MLNKNGNGMPIVVFFKPCSYVCMVISCPEASATIIIAKFQSVSPWNVHAINIIRKKENQILRLEPTSPTFGY